MDCYPAIRKDWHWVICSDMDGCRICYIGWSKSHKNKYYILTHIYGIQKKWYRWTYLLGRNRDIDTENGHIGTEVEMEGETNWESRTDIHTHTETHTQRHTHTHTHTHTALCKLASGKLLYSTRSSAWSWWWPREVEWGRRVGGRP